MRRCRLLIDLFSTLLSGFLCAQDIVWQGTFKSGAEQRRVVLQTATNGSGAWQATGFFVEFFPDPVHIDSLVLNGSTLEFTVNHGKGVYAGSLSANGASIDGTWTYDRQTASLELRRATKETEWHTPFQYQYHFKDINFPRPSRDEAKIPFSPRLAVDYMEQGAMAWTGERECVACHTNGSYMVVRPLMTAQLGPPQKELRDFFVSELRAELAADPAKLQSDVEPTQAVYIAAGLSVWDAHVTHRLSPETA